MTSIKGSGPQCGETVYIAKVNKARKVKSNVLGAMNKNSNPVQKFVLIVSWEDSAPSHFFLNLYYNQERVDLGTRKLIFGMQVNIDKHKANSRRYDVTRYRDRGGSAKTLISVLRGTPGLSLKAFEQELRI